MNKNFEIHGSENNSSTSEYNKLNPTRKRMSSRFETFLK